MSKVVQEAFTCPGLYGDSQHSQPLCLRLLHKARPLNIESSEVTQPVIPAKVILSDTRFARPARTSNVRAIQLRRLNPIHGSTVVHPADAPSQDTACVGCRRVDRRLYGSTAPHVFFVAHNAPNDTPGNAVNKYSRCLRGLALHSSRKHDGCEC